MKCCLKFQTGQLEKRREKMVGRKGEREVKR
jgi:hypothetical protein